MKSCPYGSFCYNSKNIVLLLLCIFCTTRTGTVVLYVESFSSRQAGRQITVTARTLLQSAVPHRQQERLQQDAKHDNWWTTTTTTAAATTTTRWTQPPAGVNRQRMQDLMKSNRDLLLSDGDDPLVVVVTGATGGLGTAIIHAVTQLTDKNSVIIAVDYNATALAALQATHSTKHHHYCNIQTVVADFADLQSVAAAGRTILKECHNSNNKIDILVNNAGIFYSLNDNESAPTSTQGYDLCFQVNFMSHVLLTEMLLPVLTKGRIVFVTSGMHWCVDGSRLVPSQVHDNNNNDNNKAPAASRGANRLSQHISQAYGNSKLAMLWYAAHLNRRRSNDNNNTATTHGNTTAVCACPAWAATGIAGEAGRAFLQAAAFDTQPADTTTELAGPAVQSTLNAMLVPSHKLNDNLLTSRAMFGNECVMRATGVLPSDEPLTQPLALWQSPLIQLLGGRTAVLQAYARAVILPLQRWLHDEMIIQPTSYEAGNLIAEQNALLAWSLEAVQEYLVVGFDEQ